MKNRILLAIISVFLGCLSPWQGSAQVVVDGSKRFTRADSLIGGQGPGRTAYDIQYYHLTVQVDPDKRFIQGNNVFRFKAVRDFSQLQFDLFENMQIEKIIYKGQSLPFKRAFKAVFIEFPSVIRKGAVDAFTVHYHGHPTVAQNAPWDGGFVFREDIAGKPWIGVAVQGVGASLWWPNKDQQADEVDSMRISVAVPKGLMNVSNGQLEGQKDIGNGYTQYNWFVSYPINNYNVTLNIADYAHIHKTYSGVEGVLALDYYVLKENKSKAEKHFAANVPSILQCFEHWFGPYPFYRDGFKLVETSYLGMEHQSAVAYGNRYQNGYLGRDQSSTGHGDYWDFIIIHESGHEWFGNNITAKDIADSWIHEGFTTYSEAVFVECREGKKAANAYLKGLRSRIANQKPLIGPYGVNHGGPSDIYYKGANILQTIRTAIDNDTLWKNILTGLNQTFKLQTVTTPQIIHYINKTSGMDFSAVFKEYLHYAGIPTLLIQRQENGLHYRWQTHTSAFDLPIRIRKTASDAWQFAHPTTQWQTLPDMAKAHIDTDWMYFDVKEIP